MPRPPATSPNPARKARLLFVQALDAAIAELAPIVQERLNTLAQGQGGSGGKLTSVAELQMAMDASMTFQREHPQWVQTARRLWHEALENMGKSTSAAERDLRNANLDFSLVDDESVERKILASRVSLTVYDKASAEINDLKIRMQRLEQRTELLRDDVLRPEILADRLIEAWVSRGLTRAMWIMVQDALRAPLAERMTKAYHDVNQFLIQQGVVPSINLKDLVRRTEGGGGGGGGASRARADEQQARGSDSQQQHLGGGAGGGGGGAPYPAYPPGGGGGGYAGDGYAGGGVGEGDGTGPAFFGRMRWGSARSRRQIAAAAALRADSTFPQFAHSLPGDAEPPIAGVRASMLAQAAQETRMLTAAAPMARVRAHGVLAQIRRFIADRVHGFDSAGPRETLSSQLATALAPPPAAAAADSLSTLVIDSKTIALDKPGADGGPVSVRAVAAQLRQRATELKAKTTKASEKAIIEVVALMFQAILAEDRIPASLRVWFARLQIPVLRLALAEPDFFSSAQHPARQLIDRMGACAMGFDARNIADDQLETEIKRIVQVIEQYPETGRRVFQLVLDEFKKFLGQSLADNDATQFAASLAQRMEQKEALAIQYTIDLRKMLTSVPVNDQVRDFLLHVWSEVLAMATVRHGAQHEVTLRYKRAAAELLWAVSPKQSRAERARVPQQLAPLVQLLREGMGSVGVDSLEQDSFVKQINMAVTRAFVSRGEGISQEKLAELSHGLESLADAVPDNAEGDVLLDPQSLELMFGTDASGMEVIATGGSQPTAAILAWAAELELGIWFTLDYGGAVTQVQYVWRSKRRQLHLFSSAAGQIYMVQTLRMASYLQAGLLAPLEEEALTVRATRDALAKLNATPDRLLH
ncbi:MAG: DUF1631 domain-containing protein [Burkholderiaceae bacterium]|jgi:hypothetical protein|nr:DUF1631 domain-containing protein [Burkholderiaceae bacterium]